MKPNFTIALIARNESKTLPKLIASLSQFQKYGGHIMLLDTGSTDNTIAIAKSLGCEVIAVGDEFLITIDKDIAQKINKRFVVENETAVVKEGDKLFDFASARNYIADMCETDWVWMPDCDEAFTNLNLNEVEKAIKNKDISRLEYEFVFSHDSNGNPAIRFMHSKMYRRTKLEWIGVIHEVLSPRVGVNSAPLGATYLPEYQVLLEHYQNVETNRTGYLKGLAVDCYLHPDSDRNSHYFAREMLWTNHPKSAIKEFERHIAMNRWPTEASQSMIFIGDAQKNLQQDPTASYEKAFAMESKRREPLIRLAEFYAAKDMHAKVIEYMEKALAIPKGNFYADFQEHYTYRPHELLYKAYWYAGNFEKSKENYDITAGYKPHDIQVLHDRQFYYPLPKLTFIIPHIEGEREDGLKRCIDSIKNLDYSQELIETLVITGDDTVPKKVDTGFALSTGEYIVYASDDCEFTPSSIIMAIADNKDLVAFNTGMLYPDYGNICEHFIIKKSFVEKIGGEIFDIRLYHVGVDNLLWARANKYGNAEYCKDAIVYHYHFTRGGLMDKVYEKGWDKEKVQHDREILEELLIAEGLK